MANKQIDLSALSLPELRALSEEIAGEMVRREKAEKASLLAEFENRAKASGFTLSDLFGDSVEAKKPAKRSGKGQANTIPPKYRNPQNSLETWTGRGRFPAWVKEFKEAGGNLDACLIDPKPASLLPTE